MGLDAVTLGMAKADARRRYRTRPQTLVVVGDSIGEQGGEITGNLDTRSFSAWTWANVLLNQSLSVLGNYAVGGETTTQARARLADALADSPGYVFLPVGTNNMGVTDGLATAQTDIAVMLDACDAAGATVVLPTLPPRLTPNWTGTTKTDTLALNEWIRQQGRTRAGLIVIDCFAALADGTTGNFRTSILGFNPTTDGIHLSATGGYLCGKLLADALRPHLGTVLTPFSPPDPGANLLANPRPAGNGAAAPTAYTAAGTGSGTAVWSDVTSADGLTVYKRVVLTSGTLVLTSNATVDGFRLSVGDVVNGIVEFDVSAMDQAAALDAQGIMLAVRLWNGSTYTETRYAFNYFRGPNAARTGALRVPDITVTTGTTIVTWMLELRGAMTFDFDKAGVYPRDTYPV